MNDEILENPVTGERMRVLRSTPESFKAEYSIRPHGAIPGEHFHPHSEQEMSVLSGEMHVRINGQHRVIHAGESDTVPIGGTHFQWNPCDVEVHTVEEIRPAFRIHQFFKVMFGLARDGKTNAGGSPSLLMTAAIFSEFNETIRPASAPVRLLFLTLGPIGLALGCRQQIERYFD